MRKTSFYNMSEINYNLLNGGSLAFVGDAYYEIRIREYCINKGITNLNKLHNECVKYVSRSGQNKIVMTLINNNILNQDEMDIFKRGRNYDYKTKTDEYINASGFEALIGYLYLNKNFDRLDYIINKALDIINNCLN